MCPVHHLNYLKPNFTNPSFFLWKQRVRSPWLDRFGVFLLMFGTPSYPLKAAMTSRGKLLVSSGPTSDDKGLEDFGRPYPTLPIKIRDHWHTFAAIHDSDSRLFSLWLKEGISYTAPEDGILMVRNP
jgi:hypothetical protein